MKEHPMIFSPEMVVALLEGRKTVTRRLVKIPPQVTEVQRVGYVPAVERWVVRGIHASGEYGDTFIKWPWQKGDHIWVKETWCKASPEHSDLSPAFYRASTTPAGEEIRKEYIRLGHDYKWRSPRFMPRWASRITLEVLDVRPERVQDITADDAICEGVTITDEEEPPTCIFAALWDRLHGPGAWDSNPWAWRIEFRRIEK